MELDQVQREVQQQKASQGLLDSFQDGENVLGCLESPDETAPTIK